MSCFIQKGTMHRANGGWSWWFAFAFLVVGLQRACGAITVAGLPIGGRGETCLVTLVMFRGHLNKFVALFVTYSSVRKEIDIRLHKLQAGTTAAS